MAEIGGSYVQSPALTLSLFGSDNCADLPFSGHECPSTSNSNFLNLGEVLVNGIAGWQEIEIEFTATQTITNFVLGPDCINVTDDSKKGYYYLDDLKLEEKIIEGSLETYYTGTYCNNNIVIYADTTTGEPGNLQWYKDGVAIIGETDTTLVVSPGINGTGSYQVKLTIDQQCEISDPIIIEIDELNLSANKEDYTCFNSNDGSIEIIVTNETLPIDYFLNNTPVTQTLHENLVEGNYQIHVIDANGCKDTLIEEIINPEEFKIDTDTAFCMEGGMQQTSTPTILSGGINPIIFNWANNTYSGDNYSFNLSNSEIIDVFAVDNNNCVSDTQTIKIYEISDLEISTNNQEGCDSINVLLNYQIQNNPNNLNIDNCLWKIDTSYSNTTSNICGEIAFESLVYGSHYFKLDVTMEIGCVLHDSLELNINPSPILNISADTVCLNSPTEISNQSSIFSGTIDQWIWSVSNGNNANNENIDPIVFQEAGEYEITLTAISDLNCVSNTTATALVNVNPVTNFEHSNYCINDKLSLKDSSYITDGSIVTLNWYFLNENQSSESELEYQFLAPNDYPIKLVAESDKGCLDSTTKIISILQIPNAAINLTNTEGCIPVCTQIEDASVSSNSTIENIDWYYSSNALLGEDNQTLCFNEVGENIITLIATDLNNCVDTIKKIVIGWPNPIADFSIEPGIEQTYSNTFKFYNNSTDDVAYNSWSFGDEESSNEMSPLYSYADTGTYNVWLYVENEYACKDSTSKQVRINPLYNIWVPNVFSPNGDLLNETFYVHGLNILKENFELIIFNRWGEIVFQSNDPKEFWDGKDAPQAVYSWKLTNMNKQTEQVAEHFGRVSLIR